MLYMLIKYIVQLSWSLLLQARMRSFPQNCFANSPTAQGARRPSKTMVLFSFYGVSFRWD